MTDSNRPPSQSSIPDEWQDAALDLAEGSNSSDMSSHDNIEEINLSVNDDGESSERSSGIGSFVMANDDNETNVSIEESNLSVNGEGEGSVKSRGIGSFLENHSENSESSSVSFVHAPNPSEVTGHQSNSTFGSSGLGSFVDVSKMEGDKLNESVQSDGSSLVVGYDTLTKFDEKELIEKSFDNEGDNKNSDFEPSIEESKKADEMEKQLEDLSTEDLEKLTRRLEDISQSVSRIESKYSGSSKEEESSQIDIVMNEANLATDDGKPFEEVLPTAMEEQGEIISEIAKGQESSQKDILMNEEDALTDDGKPSEENVPTDKGEQAETISEIAEGEESMHIDSLINQNNVPSDDADLVETIPNTSKEEESMQNDVLMNEKDVTADEETKNRSVSQDNESDDKLGQLVSSQQGGGFNELDNVRVPVVPQTIVETNEDKHSDMYYLSGCESSISRASNFSHNTHFTTESAVTTKHRNTGGSASHYLMGDDFSAISENHVNKDINTLETEEYRKERDRLELRKIALVQMNNAYKSTSGEIREQLSVPLHVIHNATAPPPPPPPPRTATTAPDFNTSYAPPASVMQKEVELKSFNKQQSSPTILYSDATTNMTSDDESFDVELLIKAGVLLLLGGFLGSYYAETTCHFVSIKKSIGYYSQSFHLHAGMYEYTSLDSAFSGHAFCLPYDGYYSPSEPILPRTGAKVALIAGGTASVILWFYLIFMITNSFFWKLGILSSSVAAIFQLSTFYFFFDDVCSSEVCTVGPGSFMSFVSLITYTAVACIMYQNCPATYKLVMKANDDREYDSSSYAAPTLL